MWSHYWGRQKTYMGSGRGAQESCAEALWGFPDPCPEPAPKCAPRGTHTTLPEASPEQAACCCLHHCPPTFGFTLSTSLLPFLWEAPGLTAKSQESGGWLWAGNGVSSCTSSSLARSCPAAQLSSFLEAAQAGFPLSHPELNACWRPTIPLSENSKDEVEY